MKLSERIEALEAELVEKKDQLVQATESLEAAPDEESLLIEVEELTGQVEKMDETLGALKKAEKALAVKAQPVAPAVAPNLAKHNKYKPEEPGELLFKHATAKLFAHVEKTSVADAIEKYYGDRPEVKETFDYLVKTHVDPAMTSVTGWAAELIQSDVRGFMASLENISVAAELARYAQSLSFGGFNSVTIPTENPTAATPTEPAWVAEGRPIPLTQFGFGSTTLNRYKLAAITTFTREIAERSTPAIEGLLRNGLRKAYAKVLDQALLANNAAVPNVRPAGLGAGVTPTGASANGKDIAVREDILALLTAMTGANLGSKPVLIMNNLNRLGASMLASTMSEYIFRDELAAGSLMSIPVISSGNVPANALWLVDADALALAFDTPEFDVSDVATIVEDSADATAATMAGPASGAGTGGTPGQVGTADGQMVSDPPSPSAPATGVARSLWQTYSLGIRMVAPTSWAVLRAGAIQKIATISWD